MSKNKIKSDPAAESAVLAGIAQYGSDAIVDVRDLIDIECFADEAHKVLYKCFEKVLDKEEQSIDITTVFSAARELGITELVETPEQKALISKLFAVPIKLENVRSHAKKLMKLNLIRMAQHKHREAFEDLGKLDGSETVPEILGTSEAPIFDLLNTLGSGRVDIPMPIAEGGTEYLDHLINNPVDCVGIPTPWKRYNQAIGGGLSNGGVSLIASRPKKGKALGLDEIVYGPGGPRRMGDMKVGYTVCTPDGGTAKIIAVYPHESVDMYKLTMSDGDTVEACEDHLWKVKSRRRKNYDILTTKQIFEDQTLFDRPKWQIDLPSEAHFDTEPLLLHPYFMGLLLGDGSFRGKVTITTADSEIIDSVRSQLLDGYKAVPTGKYSYHLTEGRTGGEPNIYHTIIKFYGLWNLKSKDKFIPKQFLYNSVERRWALLQGLMDTDGDIGTNGRCNYSTKSIQLAKDVKELVNSLGGLAIIHKRYTTCNGKRFESYRVYVKFTDCSKVFKLTRKLQRVKTRIKLPVRRRIEKVEYIGKKPAQCITIDHPEHLYLTNNFIVTHNSSLGTNCAMHVAGTLGIPVLYLDTEMSRHQQLARCLAYHSNVNINDITTGKFGSRAMNKTAVYRANTVLANMPYDHINIAGQDFETILGILRRWIFKRVGLQPDGKANQCLVVYDYFKLMSDEILKNMQEYQAMGFQISKLTDFAQKYDLPILSFVQVNRDGVGKDGSDVIAQSDRLLWLCHNLSIWRPKDNAEILQSGPENGTNKLSVIDCRFGPGLNDGDWINFNFNKNICKVTELNTNFEANNAQFNSNNTGFDINGDEEE